MTWISYRGPGRSRWWLWSSRPALQTWPRSYVAMPLSLSLILIVVDIGLPGGSRYRGNLYRGTIKLLFQTFRNTKEVRQMEPIEYTTMAWTDDEEHLLKQLNELGAQGWEVCAQGDVRTGRVVIGRVDPREHKGHVLLLKRHEEA